MTEIRKSILVPYDFSLSSNNALRQALFLATENEYDITLFHNTSNLNTGLFKKKAKSDNSDIEQKLLEIVSKNKKDGVNINISIKIGKVEKTITQSIHETNSKIIIYGFDKTEKISYNLEKAKLLLKIIKETDTQLITLNKIRNIYSIRRIVMPIDNTSETMQKVLQTIELAKSYKAKLYLLAPLYDIELDVLNKQKIHLNQVQKIINRNKVQSSCKTLSLNSKDNIKGSDLINQYAKEIYGDLIVIMTHQQKNPENPEELIVKSEVPVLSVFSKNVSKLTSFN